MSELLPISITSIILAWVSEHTFFRYDLSTGRPKKDKFFFSLMLFCMILFAGLRTVFNDTETYLLVYRNTNASAPIIWKLGKNPGYHIVIRVCKYLKVSEQTYILLYSAFILITFLWFIRKYSTSFCLSVFILITFDCFLSFLHKSYGNI